MSLWMAGNSNNNNHESKQPKKGIVGMWTAKDVWAKILFRCWTATSEHNLELIEKKKKKRRKRLQAADVRGEEGECPER
jgi:hypothetical protein